MVRGLSMDNNENGVFTTDLLSNYGMEDPVTLGGKNSAYFVLMNGLESKDKDFTLCNFRFVRLTAAQWSFLEKRWIIDLYRDFYEGIPRFFCLIPFDTDISSGLNVDTEQKIHRWNTDLQDLINTMRILKPGILVDIAQTVIVIRQFPTNLRFANFDRYRLYGYGIGSETTLPQKMRSYCGKEVLVPPRKIDSIGDAWEVTAENKKLIEKSYESYQFYINSGGHPTINFAIRNFNVGQNIFLNNRQRLFSLLSATEALLGGFERPRKRPTLGAKVATLYSLFGLKSDYVEENIEKNLRAVRNALSHGSDYSRNVNLTFGIKSSSEILRLTIRLLIPYFNRTYTSMTSQSSPNKETDIRTIVDSFKKLLHNATNGDQIACVRLNELHQLAFVSP